MADSNDKIIVTIDREFGSGGHEVGRRLAERLGIKLYDEELISRAAANTGYHEEYIKANDEKAPDYSVSSMFTGVDMFQTSPFARIQEEEFRIIREIAAQESCVIMGRAADYILSNERHVSIFIFAPIEDRVKRNLAWRKRSSRSINSAADIMNSILIISGAAGMCMICSSTPAVPESKVQLISSRHI